MHTISVLLVQHSNWYSNLIRLVTGRGYTHASLSLDDGEKYFYSFNFKGFARETYEKHRRFGVSRSVQLRLRVSEKAYRKLRKRLEFFKKFSDRYHYCGWGVLCAILRLPFRWQMHYFCSQFVAELLSGSGAVKLSKPARLYLPEQLSRELSRSPQLLCSRKNVI